jgi:hypothetical protein
MSSNGGDDEVSRVSLALDGKTSRLFYIGALGKAGSIDLSPFLDFSEHREPSLHGCVQRQQDSPSPNNRLSQAPSGEKRQKKICP